MYFIKIYEPIAPFMSHIEKIIFFDLKSNHMIIWGALSLWPEFPDMFSASFFKVRKNKATPKK